MSGASFRVSWATRANDVSIMAAALLGVGLAVGGGVAVATNARGAALWCAAAITLGAIVLDFPGAGHPRWSEFELSLPIPARDLQRARIVLSLAFWMLPLGLALGGLCLVERLALAEAARLGSSAGVGILLACGWRFSFGLDAGSVRPWPWRLCGVVPVAVGFAGPSPLVALGMLLAALALLGVAHVRASAPLEMASARPDVARRTWPAWRGVRSATFGRLAVRHVFVSRGVMWLLGAFAIGFGLSMGVSRPSPVMSFVALEFVVFHAVHATRLLHLGHLPFSRERLFRLAVWPPLGALLLGTCLAGAVLHPPESVHIDLAPHRTQTAGKLSVPQRYWRLASGDVPLVTAPDGESYRPLAHRLGLGSLLVAYNPYEVGREATRGFLAHQIGRFLREQRGIDLEPDLIVEHFLRGRVEGDLARDPDPALRDPVLSREWSIRAALLLVASLIALRLPLRPGPTQRSARGRRPRLTRVESVTLTLLTAVLLSIFISYTLSGLDVDVAQIVLGPVLHGLAAKAWLVLPAAAAIAVLLHRSLWQRFQQMEPPQRSDAYDLGFIEL